MTRSSRPTVPARQRSSGRRTLGVLLALALVTTAGAPSLITIRSGDTLWDLAREHGTSVKVLRQLNDLPGNAGIYAGDTLRVPGAGGSSSGGGSSAGRTHVVRPGETLSHLAVRYGTTSAAIRAANGMTGSTIYAGRRIALPGGGASTGARASRSGGSSSSSGTGAVARGSVAENRAVLAARSHPSREQVRRMVAATARKYGVSPSLAVAIAYQESGFQQRVVSGVNAIGVMQVLPSTGRVLGQQHGMSLDLLDTQDNITAGVLLLRQLTRSVGSTDRVLAGYYQGLGSIARKGVLPQTHAYIRNINALRANRFPNG